MIQPSRFKSIYSTVSFAVPIVMSLVALATLTLVSLVQATGLSWTDEVSIDPGERVTRFPDWLDRVELTLAGDRIIGTIAHRGSASTHVLLPSGKSDGRLREFSGYRRDADPIHPIQAHLSGSEWTVLESPGGVGLQVSRYGESNVAEKTLVLEASRVDPETVRMEPIDSGFWVTWNTLLGAVHSTHLDENLRIQSSTILATGAARLDVEIGADGGVVGWMNANEINYVVTDARGVVVGETKRAGNAPDPTELNLAVARLGDRVLCAIFGHDDTVVLRHYDAGNGRFLTQYVVDGFRADYRDRKIQIASGTEGAILVTRSLSGLIIGPNGAPQGETFYVGDMESIDPVRERHTFAAEWMDEHYYVGWTYMSVETSAALDTNCRRPNLLLSRRISADGVADPVEVLSDAYKPRIGQPWTDGANTYALLQGLDSNQSYQVKIFDDGTYETMRRLGRSSNCNGSLQTGVGVLADGKFYNCRREVEEGPNNDYVYGRLDILGEDAETEEFYRLGKDWSLAVVAGVPWLVSEHFPYRGTPYSRVYRIGDSDPVLELDPVPTEAASKIIGIAGRPFVVWKADEQFLGGFVPEGEEPFVSTVLYESEEYGSIQAAAGSDHSGMILIWSHDEPKGMRAIAISDLGIASEPTFVTGTGAHSPHLVWDGENYIAVWTPRNTHHEIQLARISRDGKLQGPGVFSVPSEEYNPWSPRLAAASPGNLLLLCGGHQFRRLTFDEIAPPPPPALSLRNRTDGVEIEWAIRDGDLQSSLERAIADTDDPEYDVLHVSLQKEGKVVFLDQTAGVGTRYAYRVRVTRHGGDELAFPSEEHSWERNATAGAGGLLYPNPSSGQLSLRLSEAMTAPTRVWVVDAAGRVRTEIPDSAIASLESSRQLDLTPWVGSLPSGVYWVRSNSRDFEVPSLRIIR